MREHKSKSKSIDLGTLQDHYTKAKAALAADAKTLAKAQDAFSRSKKAFEEARAALAAGSRAVLD